MAIAGLHIGMICGFIHLLVAGCWKRIPGLCLLYPAQLAGACSALIVAWIYSGLAGFSVPTQRASIMLTCFIMGSLLRKQLPHWYAWSSALFIVLIINPLVVLTESFWLSFVTIALITYGLSGRLAPAGLWWKWGRSQWVIGLGLVPLSLLFFQQSSTISFAANTIAIPWLGFLILPFCLLSAIFLIIWPVAGALLLQTADFSLSILWEILEWLAHIDIAVLTFAVPGLFLFTCFVVFCLFMLLPAGAPGRWLGIVWLFPVLTYHAPKPQAGDFWVSLIDVGQGLSVFVQTKNHNLLYDAGAKFSEKFDMGESIVLPYLHALHITNLDMMVVSHADNDHIGGSYAVVRSMPVKEFFTSDLNVRLPMSGFKCKTGYTWNWDGVLFTFLYPDDDIKSSKNDMSCVLEITNGMHKTILFGDIEAFAEKKLLSRKNHHLQATLITAPHHGSKTSGLRNFIAETRPDYVYFATGYRNRYHFPHKDVVKKYLDAGSITLNSVDSGTTVFRFEKSRSMLKPWQYRYQNWHYWYE